MEGSNKHKRLPNESSINIWAENNSRKNLFEMDKECVLNMKSEDLIHFVDVRDPLRMQFSQQEVDFFLFNFNLKMIDIRQLDRFYFQTSALPYYQNMAFQCKKTLNSSESLTNGFKKSRSTKLEHQNNFSYCHRNEEKLTLNCSEETSGKDILDSFNRISENKSAQNVDSRFDIVCGDCIDLDSHLYFVYKKSETHILEEIENSIEDHFAGNLLVPCSPKPKNKILININFRWYRAIVTSWPSRIPGSLLIKLVDVGRYLDVDKKQVKCYKIPEDICHKPLAFQMKMNKIVCVGCVASVEQVKDKTPVEYKVIEELGIEDNGITIPEQKENDTEKSDGKISVTISEPSKNKIRNKLSVLLNNPLPILILDKVVIEEGEYYWAQHRNFIEIYADWHDLLESNSATFSHPPGRGKYCLKKVDQVWCRAIVQSENPLSVFYLDYGNVEVISNVKDLKRMPDFCLAHEPFALKITWAVKKNFNVQYDYEQEMAVIPVKLLKNDIYQVLKAGESIDPVLPVTNDWSFQNKAISGCGGNLEINKEQKVYLINKTDDFLFGFASSISSDLTLLYDNLHDLVSVDDSNAISYENIKQGDFVLVMDSSKKWHRAQLTNAKSSLFYLIDSGKTCRSPNHFKRLLDDFCDLPPRVMRIHVNQSLLKFCEPEKFVEIRCLSLSTPNTMDAQLISSPLFAIESPPPLTLGKEITLPFAIAAQIEKNSAYFFTHNIEILQKTLKQMLSLLETSNKAVNVEVGDYCVVAQTDNPPCRAKVLKVCGERITVFCIDSGEIDNVRVEHCRELPDELYAYPPCIVKANLLDSDHMLQFLMNVTLIPREELSRCVYSVNIVAFEQNET